MQNDLISRSALIEHIKEFTNINEGYFENPHFLIRVIENQPTAYDVEKVIKKLEAEKENTYNRCVNGMHDAVFKDLLVKIRNGGKENENKEH